MVLFALPVTATVVELPAPTLVVELLVVFVPLSLVIPTPSVVDFPAVPVVLAALALLLSVTVGTIIVAVKEIVDEPTTAWQVAVMSMVPFALSVIGGVVAVGVMAAALLLVDDVSAMELELVLFTALAGGGAVTEAAAALTEAVEPYVIDPGALETAFEKQAAAATMVTGI